MTFVWMALVCQLNIHWLAGLALSAAWAESRKVVSLSSWDTWYWFEIGTGGSHSWMHFQWDPFLCAVNQKPKDFLAKNGLTWKKQKEKIVLALQIGIKKIEAILKGNFFTRNYPAKCRLFSKQQKTVTFPVFEYVWPLNEPTTGSDFSARSIAVFS